MEHYIFGFPKGAVPEPDFMRSTPVPPLIIAVVVTYEPDLDVLDQLLASLVPQLQQIVIIDNGSRVDLSDWSKRCDRSVIEVRCLGENLGIATAQNVGIQWARERGAKFVLLMDQDSIPAPNMIEKLMEASERHPDAAAVGPRYLDDRQENPPPFIRIEGLRLRRCVCAPEDAIVSVDYLISSGCLIPMSVLDRVGGMRDDLFIDYVDIEWGLRARSHGLQSYGVCSAKMKHSLGEHPLEFFGRKIPLHSPLRHYYHFRNAILLYREAWLPLNWKLVDGWRLLLKYGFYILFAKPRLEHFSMMSRGVLHGLRGQANKFRGK